jgi:hypothetical protein
VQYVVERIEALQTAGCMLSIGIRAVQADGCLYCLFIHTVTKV